MRVMRAFLMRYARSHLWMNRFVHLSSYIGCAVVIFPFARILVFISLSLLWSLLMRSLALNCLWFAFWVSTFVYAATQSAFFVFSGTLAVCPGVLSPVSVRFGVLFYRASVFLLLCIGESFSCL